MPDAPQILGQVNPTASTNTDLYTVPGATAAVCGSLLACNQTAAQIKIRIAIVKSGDVLGVKSYLFFNLPVEAEDTFEFNIGLSLAAGDKIVVWANSPDVSFNVTGVQVT